MHIYVCVLEGNLGPQKGGRVEGSGPGNDASPGSQGGSRVEEAYCSREHKCGLNVY